MKSVSWKTQKLLFFPDKLRTLLSSTISTIIIGKETTTIKPKQKEKKIEKKLENVALFVAKSESKNACTFTETSS